MNLLRLGAAVAAACVLTAGCNGDGGAESAPEPPAGGSSSPSEGGGSPGAGESDDAPSVRAASGKPMRLPAATLRAPRGWTTEKQDVAQGWYAHDPEAYWSVYVYQSRGSVTSPQELIDRGALGDFGARPEVAFDAELGGEPAFRATGKNSLGRLVMYGAAHDGPATLDSAGVLVGFNAFTSVPAGERRRIEESVLASFEWR